MTTFDWLLIISCAIAAFVVLGILVDWWFKRKEVSRLIETGISSRTNEIEALKLKTKMRDKHVGLTDEVEITNIDSWCDPTKPRQWPRDPATKQHVPPRPPRPGLTEEMLDSEWPRNPEPSMSANQMAESVAKQVSRARVRNELDTKPRKKRNPKKTYTPDGD